MIFHFKDHLDLNITGKAYIEIWQHENIVTYSVCGWVGASWHLQ